MRGPIVIPLCSRWRFKKTGIMATALWLRSSAKRDIVEFRFDHDKLSDPDRKVTARAFLEAFERFEGN